MSQNFENKKVVVSEIVEKAKNAKSIVFASYKGITVEQDSKLRNECRQNGIEYKVYKNRLVKRALEELGIKMQDSDYEGQISIAFGQDETTAARVLSNYSKTSPLTIKCGYGFGKSLTEAEVVGLASIPSREVLIAQLLGMLQTPIRGFAVALSEIAKKKV